MTAEKITVTIPFELKERLVVLKDELKTSMSFIYKEALESYLEKKEIEKFQKSALIMANIYEEDEELNSWANFEENIL
ncbi:hypothetical protein CRU94_01380 [Arcobacter sp. AHV-9/2010]|uniref:hypothetical protein n=1 Tax=Arcobacter sp. AHV-9/2010 TaxID=2021861 RepID=UPI00100A55A1|nr:hypothetical protein [Arcobacter sp. CECT 9299]RXJ96789.1 hypothetical protein CRU94_01380 [Arcobacter sp. CECT 9299]